MVDRRSIFKTNAGKFILHVFETQDICTNRYIMNICKDSIIDHNYKNVHKSRCKEDILKLFNMFKALPSCTIEELYNRRV